jgi:translation initiation factor 2 alpha subunit (eIF-2alpha)
MNFNQDNCRFYRNTLPSPDDIVMVEVISEIKNIGYNVGLIEYGNLVGLVQLSEIRVGKRNNSPNPLKIGQQLPMIVLTVNQGTKEINLSKKKVPKDEIEKFESKFKYRAKIYQLGIELSKLYCTYCKQTKGTQDHNIESIMNKSIWNLLKQSSADDEDADDEETDEQEDDEGIFDMEKADDIWNKALEDPSIILQNDAFSPNFVTHYVSNMGSRIVKTDAIFEVDLIARSFDEDGVQKIKNLFNTYIPIPDDYDVTISIQAPPTYKLHIQGSDIVVCQQIYEKSVEILTNVAKETNIQFKANGPLTKIRDKSLEFHFLTNRDLDNMTFDQFE